MIVDCAVYRSGRREELEASAAVIREALGSLTGEEFLWIGINEPTRHEVDQVAQALSLHPIAVDDMLEPHQRPKVEHYKDHVFVSVRTLTYSDDDITTHEVNIAQGEHFVLTVRHGGPPLRPARRLIDESPERADFGPVAALHAVLDHVVDDYEAIATELEIDVEEVESSIFSSERTRDSGRIYRLKRETLEFRRAVTPLHLPLFRYAQDVVSEPVQPYFRDVVDHVQRVTDRIDSIESLLDNALTAHLAQLSVQQNDDMRKLTAGATIFAIPTAIAGIYGMNFEHMPELTWTWSYPICLAGIALLCGWVFHRFRRAGWL